MQAVFVCCRDDAFDMAQEVFDRIWESVSKPNHSEKKVKKRIEAVIEAANSRHQDLFDYNYLNFLDQAMRYLNKIKTKLFSAGEPFLLQVRVNWSEISPVFETQSR